jgi:hypothetical protein
MDLFTAIFLLIMTLFSIWYIEKNKQWSNTLIIPEDMENIFILDSKQFRLPMIVDPFRTIKIIIIDDDNNMLERYIHADKNGIAEFEIFLEKEISFNTYIFLDKKEKFLNKADKIVNVKMEISLDPIIKYSQEAISNNNTNKIVLNSNVRFLHNNLFLSMIVNNNEEALSDEIKKFIEYNIEYNKYKIDLLKQSKNLSNIVDIYYNDNKVGRLINNNIMWI